MSVPRSSRTGPVLVLGASGTTGSRVVHALASEGHAHLGVSRSSTPRFDWTDPGTYAGVLGGVRAVYLLPPVGVLDPLPPVLDFVEQALGAGVRRFVLLSSSVIPEGGPGAGSIHAVLRQQVPEWTVLRPSWFMQNFERGHYMAEDVRTRSRVVTSTGQGRVAFVDTADIAAVAVRALVDPEPHQGEHLITGPQALSYDDVASVLSEVTGRRITHERVPRAAVVDRIADSGVPREFATLLAGLEDLIAAGAEDRVSDAVHRVTGRPARSLAQWASERRSAWS